MNSRQIDLIKEDCSNVLTNPQNLKALKNEHVLVTGGTGFMGSWLAETVTQLNEQHNFNTKLTLVSRHPNNLKDRAPHLASKPFIDFVAKNVCDLVEIPSDVTYVIHAAATPDNRVHFSDPLRVVDSIVQGTSQILDSCIRLPNLKKFVNISSGLVYGSTPSEVEKIPESLLGGPNCTEAGTAAYAEAKRMGESLCSIYRNQYRLPIVTLRPFAFVGPYQLIDRPWAINNFLNDAFHGGPIRILGNPNTLKSFMYPSDMANWVLQSLARGAEGNTYNLGSPEAITLGDVANKVESCFSGKISILVPPINEKKIRGQWVPDVTKMEQDLGLKQTIDIDQAISKTVKWLQLEK